ncbi:tRNA (adenosine(37)-N6)-threonylcarbamoyltransferase complex ATPase subunit type 1 TsaE [Fulvivirga kasyanovii]|uniref:tRNA threonylcarbamoyladenosine biosynthesis protein TsaE n=1 Tax=Fulvivirga kasyanovii TaxID=396812 RepID=A0ABW9RP89_9BACT|nr:tRNA (adenosine(37)-N6)-threonylcarbamoyltransferase complex ATPase subunit type 1 TsaE [Fulvivirga kasyanovii]MTI24935.1 tRNA (adenosine(37)-N6)-threonylcarbamoyltransferase complex ATPase subunit type 1 TsaE [Fulvivirga kasyanovii]
MVDSTLPRLQLECDGLEQLKEVARRIISFGKDYNVWLFEGQMGAGKTTLIKAICEAFEVEDNVNSPTFSIVNEYQNGKGEVFYHFDFYRIKDEEEAMDIGAEEYFYSGNYCFIEWPSKVEGLLPDRMLKIEITIIDPVKRLIDLARYD